MASRNFPAKRLLCGAALALTTVLAACGDKDSAANLAELDASLTNNVADPALQGALEDQIVVDPDLVGQSNANAVRPADKPMDGTLPAGIHGKAAAEVGPLMRTPAPVEIKSAAQPPVTLGAMARDQGKGAATGCAGKLDYNMNWAARMPEEFPVYPGAKLNEAAGVASNACNMRAASFTTGAPLQGVVDYYYTLAKRAGYGASHELLNGQQVLGGTRPSDDGAFVISFTPQTGGVGVSIIVNNGR